MNETDLKRLTKSSLPAEIAGRNTDPRWYAAMTLLPDPDPILRRDPWQRQQIFDAIQADPHVMGELRSIKADLHRYQHRLVPGDDSRAAKRAVALCQAVLDRAPAPHMTWSDVLWNIYSAEFRGLSAHEVLWEMREGALLPKALLDRPARRFGFDIENNLRLITRNNQLLGEAVEPGIILLNRHMPSSDNPYGVALFSSCFWAYTFKHAGTRWFVKFCERFSIPFPVGTYPAGSPEETVSALSDALESLMEAGFAALEEGGSIELKESKGGSGNGKLAQQQLIDHCNAEMSKCLTSQTLATQQGDSGSRAASETHAQRAADVNEGGREKVAFTLDTLWRWITLHNLGEGVPPPRSEFVSDEKVRKERAEIYKVFIDAGGKPSRKAMADEMSIKLADANDPDDQLQAPAPPPVGADGLPGRTALAKAAAEFAAGDGAFPDQDAIDAINLDALLQPQIERLLAPVMEAVKDGLEPEALKAQLAVLYPQLDDAALQALLARAIFVGMVWGRLNAEQQGARDDAL